MEAGSGQVADLATLPTLDEKTLVEELRVRYKRDIIYTYIGDILIALNPYKPLPIYGPEVARVYTDVKILAQHPPHIFAISDMCYQHMRRSGQNQCCVVSGESGAGKTESTKLLVQHISHLCRHDNSLLQERIIQVNPLLEAFGNAQTVMNNNSSRFGKYIELLFDLEGNILGASISEYLLEKSRVVSQGLGEKNFHIFYYMFAGLDAEQLRNNLLNRPEDHRILRKPDGSPIFASETDYNFHRDMWNCLTRTMALVGFLQEEMNAILAVLAAILMLTDIVFVEDMDVDGVYIRDEAMLEMAAELLGVHPEELASALISNIHMVRGEKIVNLKNVSQANDGRDAIAKALYGRLFGWIVRQINFMLQPERRAQKGAKIGILDIAGFENFQTNSFEQLCINTANEQLQFYFNQHIFSWEMDEYKREGVKGKDIKFSDNRPLIDLFLETPLGLLSLLDEESRFPRGTDLTFLEKVNKNCGKRPQFVRPKGQPSTFVINHYAGPVQYKVDHFLEKNRDTLSWNLLDCMKNSEAQFVCDLFFAPISDTGSLMRNDNAPKRSRKSLLLCKPPDLSRTNMQSLSKQAGKKLRKEMRQRSDQEKVYENAIRTLGSHFRNSLTDLMAKLLSAEPHFVRCIKPNAEKRCDFYNSDVVKEQLKYTGVLETVRIRRQGYATRLPHEVFITRYKMVAFPFTASVQSSGSNCSKILKKAGLKEWEIGKTKVFLKYWHPEKLNIVMDKIGWKVVHVQKYVRGWLSRRRMVRRKEIAWRDAQELGSFCNLATRVCEDKLFTQFRCTDEDSQRFNRQAKQREDDIRLAQSKLRPPSERLHTPTSGGQVEEKRKKGLYQATPIILGNPVFGKSAPVTRDPNRPSQRSRSPKRESIPDPLPEVDYPGGAEPSPSQLRGRCVSPVRNGSIYTQDYRTGGSISYAQEATPQGHPQGYPGNGYNHPGHNSGERVKSGHRRLGPPGGGNKPTTLERHYEHTLNDTAHFARRVVPGSPTSTNVRPVQTFMMNLLDEALERFPDLEKDVWAKVIYTEKSQVVGKLYLREKEVIIDSSKEDFEGKVIGLNSFPSTSKDMKLLKKIGKGVKLSRDGLGNIYATRLSDHDIICKGYKNPENACFAAEIIEHMGRLPKGKAMKIFCMMEYKSHIALELQRASIDQRKLQSLSMLSFAFVRNTFDDLDTPCWVTVINFMALDVLGNEHILQEVKSLSHLNLSDVEDAQLRRNWAKLHLRRDLAMAEKESRRESKESPLSKQENSEDSEENPPSNRSSGNQEYLAALDRFKDTLEESPLEVQVPTNRKTWAKLKVGY